MRIYFGGHLDFYHPKRNRWLEIPLAHPTSLAALLDDLGVPLPEVHLAVVDEEQVDLRTTQVTDEQVVRLYSAVDGG